MPARVRTLACNSGHSFDVAKQGYVSLLGGAGRTGPGDDHAQLERRERFLAAGHFDPLVAALGAALAPTLGPAPSAADSVADSVEHGRAPLLVDVGAGTGFYARSVLDAFPAARAVCTEISAAAARRLASAHPRAASVVADTWRGLPLADGCADAIQVVFAPRNPEEFARVLAPSGRLVVAWPGPEHLRPLREELGMLDIERGKERRLTESMMGGEHFALDPAASTTVRATMALDADTALDVALMGPSGAKVGREAVAGRLAELGRKEYRADIDVNLSVFVRAPR